MARRVPANWYRGLTDTEAFAVWVDRLASGDVSEVRRLVASRSQDARRVSRSRLSCMARAQFAVALATRPDLTSAIESLRVVRGGVGFCADLRNKLEEFERERREAATQRTAAREGETGAPLDVVDSADEALALVEHHLVRRGAVAVQAFDQVTRAHGADSELAGEVFLSVQRDALCEFRDASCPARWVTQRAAELEEYWELFET